MDEIDELLSHLPNRSARDIAIRNNAYDILARMPESERLFIRVMSRSKATEFWSEVVEIRAFGQKIRRSYSMIGNFVHYSEKMIAYKRLA